MISEYLERGAKSDKPIAVYTLADLADEALSLIQTLGVTSYVLVGHSMGGKVGQLIAPRIDTDFKDRSHSTTG